MKNQKLLLLSVLAFAPVFGQAALGPIIVTPSIVEQEREESATPITVIDQQTIEQSGANNLAELLRGQAGLHVSDLFGDGSQSTVDLRGFGPTGISNTLILIDGRRLNNSADAAAPDLSTIDLEDIKQIEILQGSGGVLYGNQAVGGVINIIRKEISDDKATVSLKAGSYGSSKIRASIDKLFGDTKLSLVASDASSDNYRDHNQSDKQHFSVRAAHSNDSYTGYVELASTDDHMQSPGALLQSEMDISRTQSFAIYSPDYFDTQTSIIRIGVDKDIDAARSFNIDFSKRVNDREFIQSSRNWGVGSLTTQDRDTQTLSGKYILKPKDFAGSSIIFGINIEQTDYKLLSSFGPQEMDQTIDDLYVSSNWNILDKSVVTAGVRYSDQKAAIAGDNFDKSVSVIGLGFTHRVDDWKLYVRADQNYRYPTVEEHTNTWPQPPGLKTQEGISYESGAEKFVNDDRYRVTLYSIDLENEIAYDATGFGANINLDATSRTGLILEAYWQWSDKLSSSISLTFLDAEITDGPHEGSDLPLVPEKTLRLDGSYQISQSTRLNLELIAVDEQVFGGDFANQLGTLDSYQVVNGVVSHKLKQWDLAFRVNNLLNEEYSESGNKYTDLSSVNFESFFPSPERNFWLSAKYAF